jgi:hypothetical protein
VQRVRCSVLNKILHSRVLLGFTMLLGLNEAQPCV